MRTLPGYLRLTFLLPGWTALLVPAGRVIPSLHLCTMEVGPGGLAVITAKTRELAFQQAQHFLRPLIKDRPAFSIAAELETPAIGRPGEPGFKRGGRDGWQIVVNASIAFSPTAMPPAFVSETSAAIEAR